MKSTSALAALAAITFGASASAEGLISEIRGGVFAHDVALNTGSGGVEDGVDFQGEILFTSPDFLQWALAPRPFVMASANSEGLTDWAGVGLAWTTPRFADRFFGEFGVGYVIHDGITTLPSDPGDPRRIELAETRVILGSEDLFRSTFAIGADVTDRISAAFVFEHLSHGQILGSGKNEGLDNLGLRIGYALQD